MRHLFLIVALIQIPAVARAGYDYSGCGNHDFGSADCLNRKELERISRRQATSVMNQQTDAWAAPPGQPSEQPPATGGGSVPLPEQPSASVGNPPASTGKPPASVEKPIEVAVEKPSLSKAAELNGGGEGDALGKALAAENAAIEREYVADYERGLADALARAYDSVQAFVVPRQSSTNPALKAEAASRLREPPQLAARFQDMTGAAGIPTNTELLSRAPGHVQALDRDSAKLEKEAERLKADAAAARVAAKKMGEFRATLGQRVADMSSIGSTSALSGSTAEAGQAGGRPNGFSGKGNRTRGSDITARSEAELNGGRAGKVELENGTRSPASLRAEGAASADSDSASLTKDGAGKGASAGESLRDVLKRRLAESKKQKGPAEEKSAATPAKSGFAQFFEATETANGAAIEKGDAAEDAGATRQPGFFLSGPDTDRMVARLVGGMNGPKSDQGENSALGDANTDIFRRMSTYLRRCERERKVVASAP